MISVNQQFAEKVHSYTLPRTQINTRSKDLVDMVLLLKSTNPALEKFQNSLERVFRARNSHPLPRALPEPPSIWHTPFNTMAAECGIHQQLEEGFKLVSQFYNSLL